ncbi:MAG: dUTP diphosphatase [Humidesulfovibrio sp.]|nr:dUTP diphosphatase [Desulfovibrio sp.]MDO9082921.1 dUTP diphosphatase [Humidesulfovibrio sp.]
MEQPGLQPIDVHVRFLHPVWDEHRLEYATAFSAGLDLRACIDTERLEIPAGGRAAIPAGIAIEVRQPGVAGFVFSRSGLGAKEGLTVSQGVGVIDPDYRGQIIVSLLNTSGEPRRIERGQRIAQLVFLPCFTANLIGVDELCATERGAGGFGHTGKI